MTFTDPDPTHHEQHASARFFLTAGETWEALYADFQAAQVSIEVEQYILMDDMLGQKFLRLFIEKAKAGIKVKLILDRVGSRTLYGSPLINDVQSHGIKVSFYNPIGWKNLFRSSTWFPRNHIKTTVIDSATAYVGSVCMAEHMRHWRDTQIRVTGDVVKTIQRSMQPKEWRHSKHTHADMDYIVSMPRLKRNGLYEELLKEMARAKKDVLLVTPYFLPPWRLRKALKKAARRGVHIQIMMSEKSDVSFADNVAHTYFPRMLKKGISILLYQKNVLHAKYVVIDDTWATVGSMNMDYLSLLRNREANLVTRDTAIVQEMRSYFYADKEFCKKVTLQYCKSRPLLYRMIGYLGWSVRWVL